MSWVPREKNRPLNKARPRKTPPTAGELELSAAINQGKRAIARDDSLDDIREALTSLLYALGQGEEPQCTCPGTPGHDDGCPCHPWEVAGIPKEDQ